MRVCISYWLLKQSPDLSLNRTTPNNSNFNLSFKTISTSERACAKFQKFKANIVKREECLTAYLIKKNLFLHKSFWQSCGWHDDGSFILTPDYVTCTPRHKTCFWWDTSRKWLPHAGSFYHPYPGQWLAKFVWHPSLHDGYSGDQCISLQMTEKNII